MSNLVCRLTCILKYYPDYDTTINLSQTQFTDCTQRHKSQLSLAFALALVTLLYTSSEVVSDHLTIGGGGGAGLEFLPGHFYLFHKEDGKLYSFPLGI